MGTVHVNMTAKVALAWSKRFLSHDGQRRGQKKVEVTVFTAIAMGTGK
jgi:hypothetical protein